MHQSEDGERQAAHQWPTLAAGDRLAQQFDCPVGVAAQRVRGCLEGARERVPERAGPEPRSRVRRLIGHLAGSEPADAGPRHRQGHRGVAARRIVGPLGTDGHHRLFEQRERVCAVAGDVTGVGAGGEQQRSGQQVGTREPAEPAVERGLTAEVDVHRQVAHDEVRSPVDVAGTGGARHGEFGLTAFLVPDTGGAECGRRLTGLASLEFGGEVLRQQMVEPVPLAPLVERDDQQVAAMEVFEHGSRAAAVEEVVAQRAREPFEGRYPQQQVRDIGPDARQHDLGEVLDHHSGVASDVEGGTVASVGTPSQGSQIQGQRPPLGAFGEQRGLVRSDVDGHGRVHGLDRGRAERQVALADLDHRMAGSPAGEGQGGKCA